MVSITNWNMNTWDEQMGYNPESLYLPVIRDYEIHLMIVLKSPFRNLSVFLILTFFLLPMSSIATPVSIDSVTISAEEPLNVILMIGDGMGFEHVELARLVEEGQAGSLVMQQLNWNASVTTHPANVAVTDSAAAGTAIATGTKTINGYVALNPTLQPLETILEFAQTLNKSTGVVSTCRIVDATPASFMTHVDDRNDQDEIARQIIEVAEVDVLLGGGLDYFSSGQLSTMESKGFTIVYNRTSMLNVTSGRIFGLFADIHMDYEFDRNYNTTPSIAEMTNKSIELLSQDTDGFFLMVEAGRIDLAAHGNDKVRTALDAIAFDKAVQIALDYVEVHTNTILIVTADHETKGLVVMSSNLNSELPSALSIESEKRLLRAERANNVTVDWTADYHTDTPVPIYCYGSAFSELPVDIAIDNTNIYSLMKDFYLGNTLSVIPVSTPTASQTTTTSPTSPTSFPDTTLIIIVSVGALAVVFVVVIVIRRR
ncbi:MAG: alkaline phosphatase [Candidatus Thorarchaeota archaeon]